jgi:hypothetical protein
MGWCHMGMLAAVTLPVALVSEGLSTRCSRQRWRSARPPPSGFFVVSLVGCARGNGLGVFRRAQEPPGPEPVGIALGRAS